MAALARSRRVGQTKAGASPLLRTVGGRQHARDEDHEDAHQKTDTPQEGLSLAEQRELGLLDDPVSSSDETNPPPKSKTSDQDVLRKPPGSTRKRKAEILETPREPEPELRKPGAAKKTRNAAPRVPKAGQFEQSRAAKAGVEENKENANSSQTPPASSGNIWQERFEWHSSQGSQKGSKQTYGGNKARNIHTAPPSAKKRSSKPNAYGSKTNKGKIEPEDDDDDEDLDNVSMLSDPLTEEQLADLGVVADMPELQSQDPELRSVPTRKKPTRSKDDAPDDAEYDSLIKPTLREQLGLTDTQNSSLPPSSAPQEDIDHISDYVRELPTEAEEGTACPICNEPVDQDSYWRFWKGLSKTVKNQAAFCHTHRRATAQAEYLAEGYPSVAGAPSIDWSALPERIKKHRMALYAILSGDAPSAHRARYAPLALTGNAAGTPRKRHDLPASQQAALAASALDSHATSPGYYGPRGRRLLAEAVMALLHGEIKRCADPVVQTSGPATFVQAVLVPEVAVRLIMEDLQCDWDAAEEVREATFEMGGLLNEEIEDRVEVGAEEEGEENEYHR